MNIKNFIKGAINIAVAATTSFCLQYPVKADYDPAQTVYLQGFKQALTNAGFVYGGYSKLPYCFNTTETLDGTVPIVVVCPMETGKRDSNYAVSESDTVSAIWMSVLVDETASQELNRRAMGKADLVAEVYANVRYEVTSSSVEDVMGDEVMSVVGGNGSSYTNSSGNSCYRRVRDLTYIGTFETTACFKTSGLTQVTVWF